MKKIFIKIFFILFLLFSFLGNVVFASDWKSEQKTTQHLEKVSSESVKANCWDNCVFSPNYTLNVSSIWLKWFDTKASDTSWKVLKSIESIIWFLIIPFWWVAVFIMTIWAWYMVLSNWQDELLNKWKKIFIWWIVATVLALTSYIIVEFLKLLLYS